ncbi:MAG: 3-hydroxyacyl-CoA dehydrogenase, partial [Proteobacteria bacterium]|nr:3-hydroxyacyl-CoA dehydrogenase [Pseudomonadota bacterium]
RGFVAEAWPALTRLGLAAGADPARLSFERDAVAAAHRGDIVQESAPERIELKQALLGRIDAALPPERVIASSTSGFTVSAMQTRMRHPERLVVGHPFNPPHIIPLVEVVGGGRTSEAAVDWAMAFYAAVGKHPIHIRKEIPGHVANRLQMALWREVVHLVGEGVVSVADVDAAIALGPGLRWAIMGPALTFHLAGGTGGMAHFLDHFGAFTETRWAELGSPKLTPALAQALIEGVAAEAGGRSIAELAAARDTSLLDILAVLAKPAVAR